MRVRIALSCGVIPEVDMRLLHQAQAAAQEVLARDPNLIWEEHAPLRRRVEQLFRENRDIFN